MIITILVILPRVCLEGLKLRNEDVLWLNGDVVFDHRIIDKILKFGKACMGIVNETSVGDKEVKYTLSEDGLIREVSKKVKNDLGEILGINFMDKNNIPLFIKSLEMCKKSVFFEKGIEMSINKGLRIYSLNVSNYLCIEIDFKKDLEQANKLMENLKS